VLATLHADVVRPLLLPGDHLSAASGLVRIGHRLFVVADDENSLGVFDLSTDAPGRLLRLFAGELPAEHAERKAAKADLEALAVLPPFGRCPHGALMAFGSGSRPSRMRAALIAIDAGGELRPPARVIDLAPLYAPLRARFADLNIEGAFVAGETLCLLQRGNVRSPVHACIAFDWPAVERWLAADAPAPLPASTTTYQLGELDGVPLAFTDGAPLPDGGWVFCAAAEDTSDSYADGRCLGSAIGVVDAAGAIVSLQRLSRACKAEGISASADGDRLELLLVTDADDRQAPALLLSTTFSRA
jgi:hypothetical protein